MVQALEMAAFPFGPGTAREPGQSGPGPLPSDAEPQPETPSGAPLEPFEALMLRLTRHARQNMQGRPAAGR